MRVHDLTCAFSATKFRQRLASLKPQRLTARIVCILLAISLLCNSTPAAPQTIVSVTSQWQVSFGLWLHTSGTLTTLNRLRAGDYFNTPARPETQSERNARVKRLRITPGEVTAHIGEVVRFSAIAYGEHDDTIGGVEFQWRTRGEKEGFAAIGSAGEFSSLAHGTFTVSVTGAGRTAQTVVTVLEGLPPVKERNVTVKHFSTRNAPPDPQTSAGNSRTDSRNVFQKTSFASSSTPAPVPLPQGSDQYGWNLVNYMTADDPGSQVGDPPGTPEDGGAGNGNFQIKAPVLSLPGRGLNINLALTYNAHLWHKAGANITYDIDRGWPGPGWSFGFGKMADIGDGGAIVVEPDGTRHGFNGTATGPLANSSFSGRTNDGSFIDYACVRSNSVIVYGSATLPNGMRILYGAAGDGAIYPTHIIDPNGNFINVSYRNNAGPQIDTVTDTLGRIINFHYDSNNLLTAVTAPPYTGATARTLVRLHYQQQFINPGFSGVTTLVRAPTTRWLLDAIYYPATNTGYWFNDSDSFLTNYGVIKKVVEQRNMAHTSGGLTDMGTVTAGTMTTKRVYTWQTTASSPPTYTTLTETWAHMDTSAAVTTYVVDQISTPRTTTVTLPNGVSSIQYSHNAPGQFNDGLVFKDETYDVDGTTLLSRSEVEWMAGDYNSPRPKYTTATTRQGANLVTTGTEFTYPATASFNQATEVRNYDFGYVWQGTSNVLLRKTATQYENSSNYTNRHIFNLPKIVSVYSGTGTRVSQTEYTYDGGTLENTPNVVQHLDEYDPYAPVITQPGHYITQCSGCPPCSCVPVWIPPSTTNPYNPQTVYRGNITQIKKFADAANLDQLTAAVETRSYDMTGNIIEASPSCCQQTSLDFSTTYQYAYPEKQTRGSSSDVLLQVSTSSAYNFNTGLITSTTDANGRLTQTSYVPSSLRPETVTLPTNAHIDYAYDDIAMTVTERTYLGAHPADTGLANETVKSVNGRGQTRLQSALGAAGVSDFVDSKYDVMGRLSQQSAPYRTNDTPQLSTILYDSLGRTTRVTAPDGSVTESYYNETDFDPNDSYQPARPSVATPNVAGETVLLKDAWGRERWGRENAQGKLVEVVEPAPLGSGSVATGGLVTTYSYDTLGSLTGVVQDQQTRSFKYDSLGRMTAQKLAEAQATLNAAGAYVPTGGTWSEVFTYNTRSNLTSRTDARGAKTVYSYLTNPGDPQSHDPLNRVRSVSWDTSGCWDTNNPVAEAKALTYAYRTKTSGSQARDITQIETITTTDVGTESYTFDTEGRVASTTVTLNSRPLYPFAITRVYDELNRIKDLYYPAQYGNGNNVKIVHHDYDVASRLSGLTYDGQSFASSIVYNAASRTTSMRVGQAGANQIIETYGYAAATGLLDSQTIARDSAPTNYLLNLSYDYAGSNGKRTGQLKTILNNLNHNKDRSYSYDALRRLREAKGGPSGSLWTQTYGYDRYGNRTSVTASGYSAKNERSTRTDLLAKNTFEPPAFPGNDTKAVSDSPLKLFPANANTGAPDPATPLFQGGPPTFTNDPLTTGIEVKAVHVTELRDAINALRLRAGLGTVTWAETVSSGVNIKASHITEMRTRLEQARTALSLAPTTYTDPGLAAAYLIKKEHIQEIRDSLKAAWTVSSQISRDGHASLSYEPTSNRITTSGFAYDAAGNQVRALIPGGAGSQRYQYDAANRLVNVKTDDGSSVIASYTYSHSSARLMETVGTSRTYFASDDGTTVAEFGESGAGVIPNWSKSYIYVGGRLLSTLTPNGSGGEAVEHHHPDRLGTRLITTPSGGSSENATLPFGTVISSETTAATNRRFTSYDRSGATKLDYAVNRHYDSQQGRFTQVDPAGMKATKLEAPQTLNLYAYCANDPINHTDPSGLGFFSFLKKLFRIVLMVAVVAALVVITVTAPFLLPGIFGTIVSWTAFVGVVITAGQLAAEFIGHINQWLHRCRVPDFAGLSAGRQEELRQRGVTPEQWDGLKNKARLAYFNIVAAIASVGLSLAGWLVDWSEGRGIQQDRVFFIAGPGATNLSAQVAASRSFSPDINGGRSHPGYEVSSRQNVFFRSLQLSFTPQGDRFDADLDTFNPNMNGGGPLGFVLHGLSVFSNRVSDFFGGSGKTNPYNVAYRSSWECK